MVLRLGNFKMPAIAMEIAKTLNLTQRLITIFWGLEISKWPHLPRKPQKHVKNLKCSELDEISKCLPAVATETTKTLNLTMTAIAMETTKKRENFKVLGIGWNFKMPAVAMETAKTLNLTQRWITTFWSLEISNFRRCHESGCGTDLAKWIWITRPATHHPRWE